MQTTTQIRQHGTERSLKHVVNAPGQHWSANAQVFKKAGWLSATVHVIWEVGYTQAWCLVTNSDDTHQGWLYAQPYGQWHTSRIWTPDHAAWLLLVMALAYAFTLTLGTWAFDEPDFKSLATKGVQVTYSLFRLGLRLFDHLCSQSHDCPLFQNPSLFFPSPLPFP